MSTTKKKAAGAKKLDTQLILAKLLAGQDEISRRVMDMAACGREMASALRSLPENFSKADAKKVDRPDAKRLFTEDECELLAGRKFDTNADGTIFDYAT